MLENTNELLEKAVGGDMKALEKLIESIKDNIYNLSLRMLWNPVDAEDVTQEILIKVITNLAKFRRESKFSTWVYKITYNHLINIKKRGLENQELSFDIFENGIKQGFTTREAVDTFGIDRNILEEELKISCTHAMLLCLDRESRMIYVLSSMFNVNSIDGGTIMNITPEAYRKRLSRIREKMKNFMESNCGLTNGNKTCSCNKRIEVAIESKRINPKKLIFANQLLAENIMETCKEEMEQFDQVSAVFTCNPYYLAPENIFQNIKDIITSKKYKILEV